MLKEVKKGVVIGADEFPDAAEVSVYKGLDVSARKSITICFYVIYRVKLL